MRSVARRNIALVLLLVQVIFIVVFATFTTYDTIVSPQNHRHSNESTDTEPIRQYYGSEYLKQGVRRKDLSWTNTDTSEGMKTLFHLAYGWSKRKHFSSHRLHSCCALEDVHVMVVIGFGFLMVFLRKYGYSSVGFTLLMTAVIIQWAIVFQGLFNIDPFDGKVHLSISSMLDADVATAAVLISMGAVLGRTTPLQLVVMGIFEIIFYSVNVHLCTSQIRSADLGGSMVIHVYGAYFGLAVSRVLGPPSKQHDDEASHYTSDILAMIGTTFLWVFWPSFNGVLATGHLQHRAVLNTYLALAASCVTAMATSSLFVGGLPGDSSVGKFSMVHVQNATLAGGVAVGAVAHLMLSPAGALIVGSIAGIVSVVGYAHLQPFLLKHFHLHDTCGVHNLHGIPGIISGITSAVMAAIADEDTYKYSLYQIYPARAPTGNSTRLTDVLEKIDINAGSDRDGGTQAAYQVLALASSLGFGLLGGGITGLFIRDGRLFRQVTWQNMFRDSLHWHVAVELPNVAALPQPALSKTPTAELLPGGSEVQGRAEKPSGPKTTTKNNPTIPGGL